MKDGTTSKQWLNRQLKDELFFRPANSLLPIFVAVPLLLASWVLEQPNPWLVAAGLGLSLLSIGWYVTRVCLAWGNTEGIKARILQRAAKELEARAQKKLEETRQKLVMDQDPRTEQMFDRLISLQETLKESLSEASPSRLQDTEILAQAELLVEASVSNLLKSWELWRKSRQVPIAATRDAILGQRDGLLSDTEASIESLEKILLAFVNNQKEHHESEARRIRAELETQLEISERVNNELDAWSNPDLELKH